MGTDNASFISTIMVLFLLVMSFMQAKWDNESDPEQFSNRRDCYVMKNDGRPAYNTNLDLNLVCRGER